MQSNLKILLMQLLLIQNITRKLVDFACYLVAVNTQTVINITKYYYSGVENSYLKNIQILLLLTYILIIALT